jgi:beta-galactosidase
MPTSDFGWEMRPEGILEVLELMKDYAKPLYITENGIADKEDKLRPRFIIEHLKSLDKAINEEKIDVRGYFHWSIMDNYEWAMGFKMKFGLYAVNFKTKERTPRKSATVYKEIIENREITGEIEKKAKSS